MIKRLILVFIAFLSLNVYAQQGTTSPYSFYGIGSLNFKGTAENRSMGGLSIFTDSIHMNLRNPASYAGRTLATYNGDGNVVKFAVGGSGTSTTLKTNNASDKTGSATFDYLAFSFPIGKLGIGFGLLPYTSVGYKLESLNSLGLLGYRYQGEGGVNKTFLGIGYQVSNDLSVGIDISYNFGNIQNNVVNYRYDPEGIPLQYHTKENDRSDLSGLNYNFGVTYTPMISERLQLTSSFTYTPKSDLTSNNERTLSTIILNPTTGAEIPVNQIEIDLEASNLKRTKLTLPTQTSIGIGIGQPRKWFLGTEYSFMKTSEFSNELLSFDNAVYEDASSFSAGGFYVPQYNSFKYWKRIVYRAGARFENVGLKINGESINEFGMSFGVGLPMSGTFSNINLGFELGQRGTTNQNLVKENFINFQISLSLNGRWFGRRKYN